MNRSMTYTTGLHLVSNTLLDSKWVSEWRHHGLGMLQAEIDDSLRVHVWHPDLVRMPDTPRRVHDHRFNLESTVLVGEIFDEPWSMVGRGSGPTPFSYEATSVWEIRHAKEQIDLRKRGCSTAGETVLLEEVWARAESVRTYTEGDTYRIARRDFHTTYVRDLAVTLVHRSEFDERLARILGSREEMAISGIQHDTSRSVINHYVEMARLAVHEKLYALKVLREGSAR